ncbi:MAG: L,D-transpeptidase family protein [Gammaproteobacteria bacterium]|nr:L,D-transpeptidase family protein [Gammaproteobacteria bacterium]
MLCRSVGLLVLILVSTPLWGDAAGKRTRVRFDHTPATRIVVDKSERELVLYLADGRKKTFRIGLGGDPTGHKWRKGDSRTPEGDYVIDMKNIDSEYYLSVRISYPNDNDVATAKRLGVDPGGQIMIHGFPNDARPPYSKYRNKDWTDGCIAVSNSAMQEIWLAVREHTPITIQP